MFEARLAAIEGADFCVATGSGMSAMFSSCHVVITEFLPKWGVTFELVKGNAPAVWAKALSKPTKAVHIETPSNPLMEMRVERMVANAQSIAELLEAYPEIKSVRFPGLKSHPDHELATFSSRSPS